MIYMLVTVVYVLICFLLVVVILLQQGKGGDIANAFGGGASQAVFGARSGATVLSRATTVLAALFIGGALVLTIMAQRGPGSVLGGREGPAPLTPSTPTQTLPPPATQTPAPQSTAPAEGDAPAESAPNP